MTARIVVRRALSVEADEIRDVIRSANEEFRGVLPAGTYRAYVASAMDVEGRMEQGTVLVATVDDAIAGSISFFEDANDEGMPIRFAARTAGLRATAVRPETRGLGLGRALVQAVIDRSAARGSETIALHTADAMVSAIALYRRMGFERRPDLDYPAGDFFTSDDSGDLMARGFVRPLDRML